MKRNIFSPGFSLIELLVVVAIIGMLSSVTLATLSVARKKGFDAAIKADLDTVRKQIGLFEDENGHYGEDTTVCDGGMFAADATLMAALAHATSTGPGGAICIADDGDLADTDGTESTSWAVAVPLKTDGTKYWCVDSFTYADIGVADNTTLPGTAQCVSLVP